MILLDTNAAIWIDRGHRRTRDLLQRGAPLYLSPATLLELQFLVIQRLGPNACIAL